MILQVHIITQILKSHQAITKTFVLNESKQSIACSNAFFIIWTSKHRDLQNLASSNPKVLGSGT